MIVLGVIFASLVLLAIFALLVKEYQIQSLEDALNEYVKREKQKQKEEEKYQEELEQLKFEMEVKAHEGGKARVSKHKHRASD